MFVSRYRALRTCVRAALAQPADVSRLALRVGVLDCDINLHLTNNRYLSFMDLGRMDFFIRSGLWRHLSRGVRPVVVEAHVRFLKEMKPRTQFLLDTRLVTIDGKAATFEQTFLVNQQIHARGHVVSLTLQDGRVIPPDLLRTHVARPLLTDGDTVLTH